MVWGTSAGSYQTSGLESVGKSRPLPSGIHDALPPSILIPNIGQASVNKEDVHLQGRAVGDSISQASPLPSFNQLASLATCGLSHDSPEPCSPILSAAQTD